MEQDPRRTHHNANEESIFYNLKYPTGHCGKGDLQR